MAQTRKTTSPKKQTTRRKARGKLPKAILAHKDILLTLAVFLFVAAVGFFAWPRGVEAAPKKLHFIQNSTPADAKKLKTWGYNIIDTNPDISSIKSLPSGTQAMVWMGSAFCPWGTERGSGDNWMGWSKFKSFVYGQRNNTKIYGYFVIDEPNTRGCGLKKGKLAQMIRDRADYIHCFAIRSDKYSNGKAKVASDGSCLDSKGKKIARKSNKKAYIVDEYQHDYAQVSHAATHADIFAIDPYPCRPKGCKYSGGDDEFLQRIARAKKYYAQSQIAPTYQAFGGDGWKLPTATQMKQIQAYYDKYLPKSEFDVTYSYSDKKSGGPEDTYPGLIHAPASLQKVMKDHNFKK